MSPTMQMAAPTATYTPTSDALDRHDYGVAKNRKQASTGGGRAWSEDEEVYLLQTRLQKMPYKHIAAHLKKTELACRLHYHQLSHGSNRRNGTAAGGKPRTTSVSSGSSVTSASHSPVLPTSMPSPIHEHSSVSPSSRSATPPDSSGSSINTSYSSSPSHVVQLPCISSATGGASSGSNTSPRLPTILPKPASMTLSGVGLMGGSSIPPPLRSATMAASGLGCGYTLPEPPHSAAAILPSYAQHPHHPHHAPALPTPHHPSTPPLRLDCSALPRPAALGSPHAIQASQPNPTALPAQTPPPTAHQHQMPAAYAHVDMARLNAVYVAHRSAFWTAVANDYGCGATPYLLEQAWKAGLVAQAQAQPITPVASPGEERGLGGGGGIKLAQVQVPGQDKTRISAILGIDANPRSPKEREIVRRIEETRCA